MKLQDFLHKRSPLLALLTASVLISQLSCSRFFGKSQTSNRPSAVEQAAIDQILERYEQALGGRQAIDGITSYKMEGSFQLAGMNGRIEGWRKDPDKTLTVLEFPRAGTLKKGFDGQTRWVQTPAGIVTDTDQEEIAEMERDSEVFSAGKIKSLFETMRLDHNARLDGREVRVIEGRPFKGPAERLYFDVENGLLVRWDMARKQPNRGTVFVRVHLDDYKDVSGLKVPFKVRFAFESFSLMVMVEKLEHNIAIDDAIFHKPQA
jgi:zinc protease